MSGRPITIDAEYWPDQRLAPADVARLQWLWARRLVLTPLSRPPRTIAGCDVHLRGDRGVARVVVLSFPDLEVVERAGGEATIEFPYVPGLLSWRELPALLDALGRLRAAPDLLFADGQGVAHPRGFGLACHLGLAVGLPTLGCAKSILRGEHAPVGESRGARQPLIYHDQVVGTVLRTKDRVKPLYVSPGHLVTLDEATGYVLQSCTTYRLPEPSRLAHLAAQAAARSAP